MRVVVVAAAAAVPEAQAASFKYGRRMRSRIPQLHLSFVR